MKLDEMNLKKAYGDVPESFQHRVQYALRQTEEEKPVKRFTLRAVALVLVLTALATTAVATVLSNTAERFGMLYGPDWKNIALNSSIAPGGQSVRLGDLIYTLDDVIVTGISLEQSDMDVDSSKASYILASGTIKPVEGANIVLIPEDYALTFPWNYDVCMYGSENMPENPVSVEDHAAEKGAKIVLAYCVSNGLTDKDGNVLDGPSHCDIGYTTYLEEDGSLAFTAEIIPSEPLPLQDEYTLSFYIANWEVTPEGEWLREEPNNTWQKMDWVVTVKPTVKTDTSFAPVEETSSILYANWYDEIESMCKSPTEVTVYSPEADVSCQVSIQTNGAHADGVPVTEDDEAVLATLHDGWEPQIVYVTFPNGGVYLASMATVGYHSNGSLDSTDKQGNAAKHLCIHFPRTAEQVKANGVYASSHQEALDNAWQQMNGN